MSLNHQITASYNPTIVSPGFTITGKETLYTESNTTLRIECNLSLNSISTINTTSWTITLPPGYQMPAVPPNVTGSFFLRNKTGGVQGTFLLSEIIVSSPTVINIVATSDFTIGTGNIYHGHISLLIAEFVKS